MQSTEVLSYLFMVAWFSEVPSTFFWGAFKTGSVFRVLSTFFWGAFKNRLVFRGAIHFLLRRLKNWFIVWLIFFGCWSLWKRLLDSSFNFEAHNEVTVLRVWLELELFLAQIVKRYLFQYTISLHRTFTLMCYNLIDVDDIWVVRLKFTWIQLLLNVMKQKRKKCSKFAAF